jgi:hypothetical protein
MQVNRRHLCYEATLKDWNHRNGSIEEEAC